MSESVKKQVHIVASGGFRLFNSEDEEIRISITRGAALLAYLAFSETSHATRDKLASLLWSESDNSSARTSLRQCVYQLKRRLDTINANFLTVTKESVTLDRSIISSDLDILNYTTANDAVPDLSSIPDPERLLEGFDGLDPALDDWLRQWRLEVDQGIRSVLTQLVKADALPEQSKIQAANALLRIDPTNETAARLLITEEAKNGNSAGMLRVYQKLWDALDEEWGEEPSMDLQNFISEMRMKFGESTSPIQPVDAKSAKTTASGKRGFFSVVVVRISPGSSSTLFDLEEFEEGLKAHSELVTKTLQSHGAVTIAGISREIFAVFGYPSASEDDAQYAVNAILELQENGGADPSKPAEANRFRLNIGMDAGLAYLRLSESDSTLFDLFGTPVETATELSRRTEDAAFVATHRSLRRLQTPVSFSQLEPLNKDDVAEPVVAVHGNRQTSNLIQLDSLNPGSEFVGRTQFLSNLNEILISAEKNNCELVSVSGEPGVGKTRLVTEFLWQQMNSGKEVYFVRCSRQDRSAPLEPMLALNAGLDAGLIDPEIETSLNGDFPEVATGGSDNEMNQLLPGLIQRLSNRDAIVLFDDWQWADDASRNMVGQLARSLKSKPLMFLFTIRTNQITDEYLIQSHQIHLPSLTEEEASLAANKRLGWQPEEQLERYIYDKSGGNPLFIEEICHAITYQIPSKTPSSFAELLPGGLQALIVSRLERLDPDMRKFVEAAAVFGDGISLPLLGRVTNQTIDDAAITQLAEIDFFSSVQKQNDLYFKHGITCDVIYNTIDLSERKSLHADFAKALEAEYGENASELIPEQLALHYRGAGEYKIASGHALHAGDKALSISSLDRAQAQYASALELIDHCEPTEENRKRWLHVAMRWGLPCVYAPSKDQIPVLLRALRIAREFGETSAMAVVNHWIGYIYYVIGNYADSIKMLSSAEIYARDADNPRIEADATVTRGFAYAARCEYARARLDIETSIKAKDENPGKSYHAPVLSSFARAVLAIVTADQGDFEEAEGLILDALSRVQRFEHEIESSICNMGSAVYLWQGRWEDALELSNRSYHRSELVNSPYLIGMARCLNGYSRWKLSGDIKGVDLLCAAADRLWKTEMRLYISFAYGWVSDACHTLGRTEAAYNAGKRTLELAQKGDPIGAAMASRTLAAMTASEHTDGLEKALAHMNRATAFAKQRNSPHEHAVNEMHLARLYLKFNQPDRAIEHIDAAAQGFESLNMVRFLDEAMELRHKLELKQSHTQSGSQTAATI